MSEAVAAVVFISEAIITGLGTAFFGVQKGEGCKREELTGRPQQGVNKAHRERNRSKQKKEGAHCMAGLDGGRQNSFT